ncbi:MAG: bifunctional enoyl-CoA hydratase/phosphate acetyltransferase, partial [Ideonella sp.]|nr:bifunctional enoyl-CoA hydratase/phosphate acetyltransferase [Ideonella sp.]
MSDTDDDLIENLTYDEIQPGQRAQLMRTLTRDDISAFALISGDVNPAHVDAEYAEGTRFGGVIAHGMFAGALISSVLGTEFPGPGTIYLEQSLHFHGPVRVGDTLTVSVQVLSKDDARHNLTLDCQVVNQRGEAVVTGQALVRAPLHKVARPRAALPTMHLFDPEQRLADWMLTLRTRPAVRCAVVHPCDAASLQGALEAAAHGLIDPVLVGPSARVRALAAEAGLALDGVELVDTPHSHASAATAADMALRGEVAMLMKGSLSTEELMQAVIARPGLHTGRRMSHVYRF